MKNLTTLLIIMLFSTGAVMAQSSEAFIDQSGVATNDVFLTQSSGAFADVDQEANGTSENLLRGIGQLDAFSNASSMTVTQKGWGGDMNELRAMQYGSGHDLNATQHNSGFAKVEQRGNDNSTRLQQYLAENEADIYQSNRGNSIALLQNGAMGGGASYADVNQTGRFNVVEGIGGARAQQLNGPNELYLNQSGNNNVLQLLQDGVNSTLPSNVVNLDQLSNGNMAQISQSGGSNNVNLTQ